MGTSDEPRAWRHRAKRFVRRWTLFCGSGYLLLVVLMWFLENRLVYFPTTAEQEWYDAPSRDMIDVAFPSADGTALHGWWLPAPGATRTLVIFHGNGGNLSGRGERMVRMRAQLGVNVFIFDYPGYGKSAGTPNEPNCYAAAEGALMWLHTQQQIPTEQLILYGESLGGGVATEMAVRHPTCAALVLVKTFTLLPAAAKYAYPLLPTYWLMSNRYDNLAKIGQVRCPILIANAVHDEVIPFALGEQLFAAAPAPKQFVRIDAGGHNDSLPETFWPTLRSFLALPAPPGV